MLERQAQPTDISPTRWEVNFATTNHLDLALQLAKTHNYKELEWLILLKNDALEGIQSHIALDSHYPTGIALVRETPTSNTTNPLPPGHPLIESNNLLLRALSTFRGIDWALTKANKTDIQLQLRNSFLHLIEEIKQFQSQVSQGQSPYSDLASMERIFNLFLKHALIQAGLTDGLNTEQDFESILTHYRNLASTLDPAKSMVTIQHYDSITHTETAYPITQKTPVQLEQLRVMASPETSGENFHSAHVPAFRIANAYFYELITQQDRRLPAGCRSTIAPTVKNAYVVHNQLRAADNSLIAELWLTRGGTLVYTGPGERLEQINTFAKANLEQLQEHVARLRYQHSDHTNTKLHLAILLTGYTPDEQTMVSHSHQAKESLNKEKSNQALFWSHIPLNELGLAHVISISNIVRTLAKTNRKSLPSAWFDTNKADRLIKAVQIITIAMLAPDVTNYISCASGQDRTGTACEAVIQRWLTIHGILLDKVQQTRSLGIHNAVLANLATPGSTGMKPQSTPGDYFPLYLKNRLYRNSADTGADTDNATPLITEEQALVKAHEAILWANNINEMRCALHTWITLALYYSINIIVMDEPSSPYARLHTYARPPLPIDITHTLLQELAAIFNKENINGDSITMLLETMASMKQRYLTEDDLVFTEMEGVLNAVQPILQPNTPLSCRMA